MVTAAGLIAVLAGLLFKAGGVPAHFWVPDVTDGTSAPVAAFVTTVPKIGALRRAAPAAHRRASPPPRWTGRCSSPSSPPPP